MNAPAATSLLSFKRLAIYVLALVGATAAVAIGCSLCGQHPLSWEIWQMRMFRLAGGAIVGISLAAGGMALQALLRNPLAEPYILGISSGAGVGVLTGTVLLGWVGLSTPAFALVGALLSCLVVYGIAQRRGRLNPYVLLLSGVIVNVFNGAVMFTMLLFVDRGEIIGFIRWGMGELPQWIWSRPGLLGFCGVLIAAGWVVLLFRGAAFNALGLGDDVASSSGVPVHWLRVETFAVVGLMTAAAVCLAGPIGFVGLIVPHVCRMVMGPDHRRLVIFSGFAGAIFLMLADTFCRTAGPMMGIGKIPVGVVTALFGGPFFIYLLRRRLRETSA